ncbi:hypothetical protein DFH08DRAFT_808368 [Mycena albidolilacea]|uniref:Uncharacterized protein n=1 Tax=Mycena albidolilacea TaxID=1033008 RepID=A0AAD7ETW4_9AGAR|nr:hypothetical protein DFH08DRAFT_808368 [Mycena albidolilacea]
MEPKGGPGSSWGKEYSGGQSENYESREAKRQPIGQAVEIGSHIRLWLIKRRGRQTNGGRTKRGKCGSHEGAKYHVEIADQRSCDVSKRRIRLHKPLWHAKK